MQKTVKSRKINECKNLIGFRCNHLLVIGQTEETVGHNRMWICKCDCSKEVMVKQDYLLRGYARSCGCQTHKRMDDYITVWISPDDQDIRDKLKNVENVGNYIKNLIRADNEKTQNQKKGY